MAQLEYTGIGWRYVLDKERHHRERLWNYKGCAIYHITLNTEQRFPIFGTIAGETEYTAYISLSTFGKAVAEMFRGIPAHQSPKGCKLRVLALRVMPDHLHGVIQVLEPMPKSIGEVIRSYKSACTALYKKEFLSDDTFGRIFSERKSIWEHIASGYHERILHCEGQLDRMIRYVKDNPRRLWLKHFNPDLFKLHNNLSFYFQDERGNEHIWKFRALGNLFLINAYQKQYLQCSRHATTQDIDNLLQAFSDRAELGAITITAAISEGEKTITKALRSKRFPLIVLLKDGFPKIGSRQERFFKPGGVYFDACAVGRLLLLEPYPEVLIEKEVSDEVYRKAPMAPAGSLRYHFLALNYIARIMASSDGKYAIGMNK